VKLYRMMKAAADGMPETGDTFAKLGIRPARPGRRGDILASDPVDVVRPGKGGMSVAADAVDDLPTHMRPPRAQFPIWEIDTAELGEGLLATPAGPPHYVVEPAHEMTLAEMQFLLAATRDRWRQV
jgi:hypothetical protein